MEDLRLSDLSMTKLKNLLLSYVQSQQIDKVKYLIDRGVTVNLLCCKESIKTGNNDITFLLLEANNNLPIDKIAKLAVTWKNEVVVRRLQNMVDHLELYTHCIRSGMISLAELFISNDIKFVERTIELSNLRAFKRLLLLNPDIEKMKSLQNMKMIKKIQNAYNKYTNPKVSKKKRGSRNKKVTMKVDLKDPNDILKKMNLLTDALEKTIDKMAK